MITITENDKGVISAFGEEGKKHQICWLEKKIKIKWYGSLRYNCLQCTSGQMFYSFTRFIFLKIFVLYSLIFNQQQPNS